MKFQKLIATQSERFPSKLPFICTPRERFHYVSEGLISNKIDFHRPSNNLFDLIQNGGEELNSDQEFEISIVKNKIYYDQGSLNKETTTLSREEIKTLVAAISKHITREQLLRIAESQHIKPYGIPLKF